jgi:hypothetical protein
VAALHVLLFGSIGSVPGQPVIDRHPGVLRDVFYRLLGKPPELNRVERPAERSAPPGT